MTSLVGRRTISCKSGIHFDQADSVHYVNQKTGLCNLICFFYHDVTVEWLSVFAEKSILCQLMPVREMDLVHYLRKSGGIHVEIELD